MNTIWRNAHRLSSAFRQCKTLSGVSLTRQFSAHSILSFRSGQNELSYKTTTKYENALNSIKLFSTSTRQYSAAEATESKPAEVEEYVPSPLAAEVFKLMKEKTKDDITENFFMMNRFRLYRMWKGPNKVKEYLQSKNILSEEEIRKCERQEDDHDKFYEMYFRFENSKDYTELLIGLDRAGNNDEFFKFFKKWLQPEDEHQL